MVDLNETPCVGLRREKGAQADGLRGREGRQNTLTSSLYFKIQQQDPSFDETCQTGHRLASSHDLCYCKVKVCPQSRLSFPAFVSNLLSRRYGLKIVTLDQFYIKFNFL